MPMLSWDGLYEYKSQPEFSEEIAARCTSLLIRTADVHGDINRDFKHLTIGAAGTSAFCIKVKTLGVPGGGTKIPDGPYQEGADPGRYNWVKVRLAKLGTKDGPDTVVIVYHLLRHRLAAGLDKKNVNYGFWSVSIGINPTFFSKPTGNAQTDKDHPYYVLAEEIARKIREDLKSKSFQLYKDENSEFKPSQDYFVVYDDVDLNEDPAADPGSGIVNRRKTRIGELGYLFQKSDALNGILKIDSIARIDVPKGSDGKTRIPGWGRSDDTQIVVTKIKCMPF